MPLASTFNYLVPASGTTNSFTVTNPSTGEIVDFGKISSETGQQFCPSGVMIDNSSNPNPVEITIVPLGFKIKCPGNAQMGMQYPSMLDHKAQFTAGGGAVCTFVDFPVIPYLFK